MFVEPEAHARLAIKLFFLMESQFRSEPVEEQINLTWKIWMINQTISLFTPLSLFESLFVVSFH